MSSQAYTELTQRLDDIRQLLDAHNALTRIKKAEQVAKSGKDNLSAILAILQIVNHLVTQPAAGRPHKVEALNRAAIALLSAHLQGYICDLFEEAARIALDGSVQSLDALVKQAPTRGNPNWDNITRLFAAAGFPDILATVSWQNSGPHRVRTRLRDLNELRNRIVHGSTESVTKLKVENTLDFVKHLSETFDAEVKTRLHRLTGKSPW